MSNCSFATIIFLSSVLFLFFPFVSGEGFIEELIIYLTLLILPMVLRRAEIIILLYLFSSHSFVNPFGTPITTSPFF